MHSVRFLLPSENEFFHENLRMAPLSTNALHTPVLSTLALVSTYVHSLDSLCQRASAVLYCVYAVPC